MKVFTKEPKPAFKPVVIEIETEEELRSFFRTVNFGRNALYKACGDNQETRDALTIEGKLQQYLPKETCS